jgi:hypothetical protein
MPSASTPSEVWPSPRQHRLPDVDEPDVEVDPHETLSSVVIDLDLELRHLSPVAWTSIDISEIEAAAAASIRTAVAERRRRQIDRCEVLIGELVNLFPGRLPQVVRCGLSPYRRSEPALQ